MRPICLVNRTSRSEVVARLFSYTAASGTGIYAIYYPGPFEAYASIRADVSSGLFERPMYVDKAISKGGLTKDATAGKALADRLRQHASSVDEAENLDLRDFHARHLVVENIWIPLRENMLIETFKSVWNRGHR